MTSPRRIDKKVSHSWKKKEKKDQDLRRLSSVKPFFFGTTPTQTRPGLLEMAKAAGFIFFYISGFRRTSGLPVIRVPHGLLWLDSMGESLVRPPIDPFRTSWPSWADWPFAVSQP